MHIFVISTCFINQPVVNKMIISDGEEIDKLTSGLRHIKYSDSLLGCSTVCTYKALFLPHRHL